MSKPNWSEWIEWAAKEDSVCPLEYGTLNQVTFDGVTSEPDTSPGGWYWKPIGVSTITAYRYELTEEQDDECY